MKTTIAACLLTVFAQGALAQDKPEPILPGQAGPIDLLEISCPGNCSGAARPMRRRA